MHIGNRLNRVGIVFGVLFVLWLTPNLHSANATWKAGVARAKITPDESMWMAGYASRNHPAEGKYTDLWAKVLVLEDSAGHRAMLVSMDLVGMDRCLSGTLCDRLTEQFGLERAQIVLCFSHTHSGPVVGKNLEPLHFLQVDAAQQKLIDQYAAVLPSRVCTAAASALETLQPCDLQWGSGIATFAVNRRNNAAAKVPELRAAGQLKGPTDHDVPVLALRDAQGKLIAVLFGYACHGTVLDDYSWSGDYPGYAQLAIESQYPGCQAMFWAGCGADQNPLPRRSLDLAKQYGQQLADAVAQVLHDDMTEITGPLDTQYREVPLALDKLPDVSELEIQAKSENKYIQARAQMLLHRIEDGVPLGKYYPFPISVWQFDDQLQFIALGGEVVVDYALRLKSELRGKSTWVAGYSNDVMAYVPSLRVLQEGGYEGATAMIYYGLPTSWSPAVEETIIRTVHDMLKNRSADGKEAGD